MGGVGLGNATRGLAVLDALGEDAEIHLQSFGHGQEWLAAEGYDVMPLRRMHLGEGVLGVLRHAPLNAIGFLINLAWSTVRILRLRPDVVVVDSEYSAILPALLLGRRLVALNHAATIVGWWPAHGSAEHRWSYWSREVPDAWSCRLAHEVIVPSLVDPPTMPPRHHAVPPIVRTLPEPVSGERGWLVLRGGSTLTRPIVLPPSAEVEDVGADSVVPDTLPLLTKARYVVCHGGLSSLSEVVTLGKRAAVVPLKDHAEQAINARVLAQAGKVVLVEDGDVSTAEPALEALDVRRAADPSAGARQAAGVVLDACSKARRPYRAPTDALPPLVGVAGIVCILGAVATEGWLLSQGIIKVEEVNATQLATHALVRDGQIVLASAPDAYSESLHNLLFHPILALTPHLPHVAGFLATVYGLSAALLGWMVGRRLGAIAGWFSGLGILASPVSPILANHVISTAWVPLAGAFYLVSVLDLANRGAPRDLGRAIAAFAALLALNVGHVWMAIPIVYSAWRHGVRRPPTPWLALAALWSAPGLFRRVWNLTQHSTWIDGARLVFNPPYDTLWDWYRRMVLVEPNLHNLFPNLWILLLFPGIGLWVSWRHRDRFPPGLASMLWTAPLLALSHFEATVVWQLPFVVWIGWLAWIHRPSRWAASLHVLLFPAAFGGMIAWFDLPPGDFFTLSVLRHRQHVLDILTDELGMTAEEFETLDLRYPAPEDYFEDVLVPGLGYLVDRTRPPLPTGGSRCLQVAHPDHPAPDPPLSQELHRGGLVYRAWEDPDGCSGNARLRTQPVVVWDLPAGRIREVRP